LVWHFLKNCLLNAHLFEFGPNGPCCISKRAWNTLCCCFFILVLSFWAWEAIRVMLKISHLASNCGKNIDIKNYIEHTYGHGALMKQLNSLDLIEARIFFRLFFLGNCINCFIYRHNQYLFITFYYCTIHSISYFIREIIQI